MYYVSRLHAAVDMQTQKNTHLITLQIRCHTSHRRETDARTRASSISNERTSIRTKMFVRIADFSLVCYGQSRAGVHWLCIDARENNFYAKLCWSCRCVRDNHTTCAKNNSRKLPMHCAMCRDDFCSICFLSPVLLSIAATNSYKQKNEIWTYRLQSIESTQDIIIAPESASRQMYEMCGSVLWFRFDTATTRLLQCNYRSVK